VSSRWYQMVERGSIIVDSEGTLFRVHENLLRVEIPLSRCLERRIA